jgi:BolA protein
MELAEQMRDRLAVLEPSDFDLSDESGQHLGHAGWRPGGSHFAVRIVSARFSGLSRVARHRLVYGALGDLMQERVHALAVTALAPGEAG